MAAAVAKHGDPTPRVLAEASVAFGLLSSPARVHIVWALADGECDVSTLAARVGGTLAGVSQHLTKLKLAGLVSSRRVGQRQVYRVEDLDVARIVRLMVEQLVSRQAVAELRRGGGE